MALKLKVDDSGKPVSAEDGRLSFIDDTDNREVLVNVGQLFGKVSELNNESRQRRLKLEELESRYAPLKDISDLAEFIKTAKADREAVEKGGDLEGIKAGLEASYKGKIEDLQKALGEKDTERTTALEAKDSVIRKLLISSEFAKSDFFAGDNAATFLTPEMAERIWGQHFRVEQIDGAYRAVGYDAAGNQILSRERPGEPAGFREAIGKILDSYPDKARIMRAKSGGSGSAGGAGGGGATSDEGVLVSRYKEAQKRNDVATMMAIKSQLAALGKPGLLM